MQCFYVQCSCAVFLCTHRNIPHCSFPHTVDVGGLINRDLHQFPLATNRLLASRTLDNNVPFKSEDMFSASVSLRFGRSWARVSATLPTPSHPQCASREYFNCQNTDRCGSNLTFHPAKDGNPANHPISRVDFCTENTTFASNVVSLNFLLERCRNCYEFI